MIETNTLIIGGVVIVCLVIFFVAWGKKCKCSESYQAPNNARFTVNHPKYMVQPTHTVKGSGRENFIVPTPTSTQTITSDQLNGGFTTPTSRPMMGGLVGEITHGTSISGRNSAVTMSGNGAGDPAAAQVWRTVI
jgi:hypothetical protein